MDRQQGNLRELEEHFSEPIRDPVWRHIRLTPGLMRLVDTAEFQQLNRIRQLGPTYMVYPGATHTRFSHSIGVVHVARMLLKHLLCHRDAPTLSREGVRAFLAAALLHDVGHFPYTHSFKSLPLVDHEVLTGRIICSGEPARRLRSDMMVDPAFVAAIVDQSLPDEGVDEIRLFRNLLSGSMDPDKLDYLNRDAYFCGVPYGIQDLDFALSRIVPAGYDGIALDAAGVSAVENILFSKYLMYRAVYWHKTVRVATAMIHKAVSCALHAGEIQPDELYNLDDEQLLSLVSRSTYPPFDLIRRVGARQLLKPVAEIPFSPEDRAHQRLQDTGQRRALEDRIARDLGCGAGAAEHEVIVDLPDRISFEATFPILDRGEVRNFPDTSVFSVHVVERFTSTIRTIRLILPEQVASSIDDPGRYLMESTTK